MSATLAASMALRLEGKSESEEYTPAEIPLAGRIASMILSLVTLCVLSACLTRRVQRIRKWSALPLGTWLIIVIYCDSFFFVFVTTVFKDIGLNESIGMCKAAIVLCLTLYLSTKVCICYFLVEKSYIARGSNEPRRKDKLYIFNFSVTMGPYAIIGLLNLIWRFSHINSGGTCIIGMEQRALLPLICFDVMVNVYLTTLFIMPLRQLHSYKTSSNNFLHTMALRTFIGSCATLTSSITNLTLLVVLDGEPAWICFLSCTAEILFSVLTLHWVTSRDKTGQTTNRSYSHGHKDPSNDASNHMSNSRSKSLQHTMGTDTMIYEHYQASAVPDVTWPQERKAIIKASCEVGEPRGEEIALDRIIVTQEHAMTLTREGQRGDGEQESDGRSETTADTSGMPQRDGSMDGIVNVQT